MADRIDTDRAEERLDEVQEDIDAQRRELREDETAEDKPKFSDPGVREPIDDQIAPG